LAQTYPTLHVVIEDRIVRVRGTFPITHEGQELDRYLIEITIPDDYPETVPAVREVEGRLPKTAERHFDEGGMACLFVPDEREWLWPRGASFLEFLEGPVRSFFLFQSIVSRGGTWPHGERSHGVDGLFEFYREKIGTDDLGAVLRYVEYLSLPDVHGAPCPCGSGRKAKKCHREQLRGLRAMIAPGVAYHTQAALRAAAKKALEEARIERIRDGSLESPPTRGPE
jgi:hypothetical protein